MIQTYIEHLNLYEVDKRTYENYEYRCSSRNTMKTTPTDKLSVWIDVETKLPLYGIEEEIVMATKAHRFFIFEILDDNLLGENKTIQHIEVDYETYAKFIEAVASKNMKVE